MVWGRGGSGRRHAPALDHISPGGSLQVAPHHAPEARTSRFPETRLSLLDALGGADADRRAGAADLLVRAYRLPVLVVIRHRWPDAEAEDLVQEFFATALRKEWFARFDPTRGRFRTFLRVAAARFVANRRQAEGRLKRGGGTTTVPLDELHDADPAADLEGAFRREWVRSVFALAVEALRAEAVRRDRTLHFTLFDAYDLADLPEGERPTYAALGAAHGLGDSQVINHLAWARRRFRHHVLDTLRDLAGSDAEYRDDVRDLLGIDPP